MSKYVTTLICIAFLLISFSEATNAQQMHGWSKTGTTMGRVKYSVKTFSTNEPNEEFDAAVESALDMVNNNMSTYKADSEVSRFNQYRGSDWFSVSSDTALVVGRALSISEASDGAFDITVGPLVNLWNFGPNKTEFEIPPDEAIERERERVGYEKLSVRIEPPALKKSQSDIEIDLSGIAKGYAVDLVAGNLDKLGLESYLIEVGGEVRAKGEKNDGSHWRVGIEKPVDGRLAVHRRIELDHAALASSGDYRNFVVVDGQRYSHTIDPRSGRPVEHDLAAVSVIADDCLTADALATAIMVLGPQRGLNLAESLGVEAMVVRRTDSGLVDEQTSGFPVDIENRDPPNNVIRTIAAASVIFLLAAVAMSVGVIISGRRLRGSCGGIAALDNPDIEPECSVCSTPSTECRQVQKALKKRG